ncbi:MAG: MG2 domain-containing protein [Firmicutes bacterium]|nr:MG2 domain-containing protein [Bacillota bacterium]
MWKFWGIILISAIGLIFISVSCGAIMPANLPEFEIKVMGSSSFLSGSQGAMRVIAYQPSDQSPVPNVPVKIYLQKKADIKNDPAAGGEAAGSTPSASPTRKQDLGEPVFSGVTDQTGSVSANFAIPDGYEGSARMTFVAGLNEKPVETATDISISKKFKIYLTTDKPLYQPSQVINIRALALSVPSLIPVAEKEMTIEVQDAKGNKVFKKKANTSKFGICSAKFELADEVNMGEFKVSAFLENESSDKSVTVKKYVLPKFKVDFKKDRTFYAPGDTIKGDLQIDYFFGKPVSGGKVTVKLNTFDVEFRKAAEVKGVTDKTGHYSFEMQIPDYLVGQPLEKGGAVSKVDVEVVDTADHKEAVTRMIPISKESLKAEVFPESGTIKPGLENKIYVLTTYPDGSPVKTTVTAKFGSDVQILDTDAAGIVSFTIKPETGSSSLIEIKAKTEKGEEITTSQNLPIAAQAEEQIILRTDKAQYKAGETLKMQILTTKGKGSVYIDFVKNRQTMLTKAVEVTSNMQPWSMDITPDLMGMVTIHAYKITAAGTIRDSRNIYIAPAGDLAIAVKPDKDVYKPGEEANIDLTVTDKEGKPSLSALGVDIVDESVFALGEMLPGLERVYFLLEKELMEPKYEIHGMTVTQAVMPAEKVDEDQQALKQILFNKISSDMNYPVNVDTYNLKLQECFRKMQTINNAMYQYFSKNRKYPAADELELLVKEELVKKEDIVDPWGHKFYLKKPRYENGPPEVASMGPAGTMNEDTELTMTKLSQTMYSMQDFKDDFARPQGRIMMEDGVAAGAPPPGAILKMEKAASNEMAEPKMAKGGSGEGGQKQVKVREYFPETLYTNPQVLTDEKGKARITLNMADSITTWRLTGFANSLRGEMGNVNHGIRVFQDFFIDIDFPVALTEGDEISVPIAVYNYLKDTQTVKLKVEKGDWFEMMDGSFEKSVQLAKDEVKAVYFRIKAKKLGKQKFTVYAYGSKMDDAIKREIEILPNGEMKLLSISDKTGQQIEKTVSIPQNAIPGASKILVRLYPGVISQVVEGLDKIFQMPFGCFEQTSSTTYPNALVLNYLKKQKKITPELQMKAEGYINTGYQRLVSFEVQGGGFSWFGNAPANQILTAFGILEFRDMSKVYEVDPNVINRTQAWLARQQGQDGAWAPDANYLHQESWGKIQGGGKIPVTSYIVWALAESGYRGNDLTKGLEYLKKNAGQINDPYILALVSNAFASVEPDGKFTAELMKKLEKAAKVTSDSACWETKVQTGTYSHGNSANLETSALATLACLKVKGYENLATKGINYLVKSKDPNGTWFSTQATILSMKALILAQESAGQRVNANIKITVNGKRSESFKLTSENFDVYNQADFGDVTLNGNNKVVITMEGEGSCYYQIATKYYEPWSGEKQSAKPLSINVAYDRTTLKENDMLTETVTIRNNTRSMMNMVMVDLGVPPGFNVMTPDLTEYVGKKFMKYTMTSRQIIIYLDKVKPGETIQFKYRLQAKFPLKAKTPESKTYQYYNPEVKDIGKPVTLEVK